MKRVRFKVNNINPSFTGVTDKPMRTGSTEQPVTDGWPGWWTRFWVPFELSKLKGP